MSLYLCVDCGGTKTSAVICDADSKIVGRAFGGPSNFTYVPLNAFIAVINAVVTQALSDILPPSTEPTTLPPATTPFAAAWFGISGVDSPTAVAAASTALSSLLNIPVGLRLEVTNDSHLLSAPLRLHQNASYGVAVVGGTGAVAVSFRKSGHMLDELGRYGGWGWIIGDEGGGYSVGRETIRQLLDEYDKASIRHIPPPESKLRTVILQYFGVSDVIELLSVIHHPDPHPDTTIPPDMPLYVSMPRERRLLSLSPLVFTAAFKDSDPLALNVLRTTACRLADQVTILLAPEGDGSSRAFKAHESIIVFGGSLVGVVQYRRMVLDELKRQGHVFKHVEYVDDPAALGAECLAVTYRPEPKT
ncbi:hypothetical protein AX15_006856 [Amanita polypyramis BW_CC]|nr:hypothetical protein AX15_006856 [Amanita polypyramis BW_CC]